MTRSVSFSSTLPLVLQDADGNWHDAVVSGSITTSETGYNCRCNLQTPFESTVGAQADSVVQRSNISVQHFIPYTSAAFDTQYSNFLGVAKQMGLISGNLSMNLAGADLWAKLSAEFATMHTNIVDLAQGNANRRDPDTAFVTAPRPQLSGAPG